jgi:hypothetical protein
MIRSDVGVFNLPRPPARGESLLWVAALSFEERCIASLERLIDAGAAPSFGLLLQYPTEVRPANRDRIRRHRNYERLERLCAQGAFPEGFLEIEVDPYSFRSAQRAVGHALDQTQASSVVLDVSCLTKIHAIALADPAVLSDRVVWEMAYTVPETYGHLESSTRSGTGWRDVLFLPIGATEGLANDSHARGIVLTGHEGDRLVVALAETEPYGGAIVTSSVERRPDLRRESVRRNDKITRLLIGRSKARWSHVFVDVRDPASLAKVVQEQIEAAISESAPVLLFPFGPKPFVALTAMQLTTTRELQAWFVYPVPVSYDVDYSYGVGRTTWYSSSRSATALQASFEFAPDI